MRHSPIRHAARLALAAGALTAAATANQTRSGVVNKAGASTLGPGTTKLEPTGGQPTPNRGPAANPPL
jgi:hypothetical protein